MKIVIASDHAGYALRLALIPAIEAMGHEVTDFGTHVNESVDYPVYGARVGKAVAAGEFDLGVLICGTGVGISLAANSVQGCRAVVCSEPYTARLAKQHNKANVVSMGARVVGIGMAEMIVEEFFKAEYQAGRHARRVDQLIKLSCGEDIE